MSNATALGSVLGDPIDPDPVPSRPPSADGAACSTAEAAHRIAALFGASNVVLAPSGWHAVRAQLLVHGIGAGHELLLPPGAAHNCTPRAAVDLGARPVFFDAGKSWCGDEAEIAALITKDTAAVGFAPLYGGQPDLEQYTRIAAEHGLPLLGSLDHGLGARYDGRTLVARSVSSVATIGGAGVFLTDDDAIALAARAIIGDGPGWCSGAALEAIEAAETQPSDWPWLDEIMARHQWKPQQRQPDGARHQAGYRRDDRTVSGIPAVLELDALAYLTGKFEPLPADPWEIGMRSGWFPRWDAGSISVGDAALRRPAQRGLLVWNDLRAHCGVWSREVLLDPDRWAPLIERAFSVIDDRIDALRRFARDPGYRFKAPE